MIQVLRFVRAGRRRLGVGWRVFVRRWRKQRHVPPAVEAEYLRLIYRNLAASSPISLAMVVYLALQVDPDRAPEVRLWSICYSVYIGLRWVASMAYPREREPALHELRRWSWLAVLIQGGTGLFMAVLALYVLPALDLYAQIVASMVVLILAGAAAFSLAGRWIDTLVFAPPIYLSFAWATFQQDHPYAQGVGLLVLALFVLHLVYASNHRKSILQGFAVAKHSTELAQELQVKNLEFRELASARSRLLATVSHDLRQPAHAIGLLSERALADTSFDSVKGSLRDLHELSQSLSASLITLMDLTRLDAGLVQPRIGPVALAQVMARLEAEFGASARRKGLELRIDPVDQWVRTDPVLIQAVLTNLVSNAIKYTRQGCVAVRVTQLAGEVRIEVADTGVGIRPDKLDAIFQEFFRLDASDAGTEGLGLGLSIVRRYAGLLSHPLSVKSQPGQGSVFGIALPRADPVTPPASASPATSGGLADDACLRGLKVLVIDNIELLLVSMSKTFKGWDCDVRSAHNLAEALQSAGEQWPDVLVTDYHLGDREPDGLELVAQLRQQGQRSGRPALPAMLMTGDVSAQLEAKARDVGVQILHKPVRPKVLRASLIDLMARSVPHAPRCEALKAQAP